MAVVVNLGDGYELTYGQLTDLTVAEGDVVTTGEIIGKVSGTHEILQCGRLQCLFQTDQGRSTRKSAEQAELKCVKSF